MQTIKHKGTAKRFMLYISSMASPNRSMNESTGEQEWGRGKFSKVPIRGGSSAYSEV